MASADARIKLVSGAALPDPPYPADTKAKGWRFDIDVDRIEQSDTWAIAEADERPWLLMMWVTSWKQVPTGSYPADDRLIAARIGMRPSAFAAHKETLLRGWWHASDGRIYHPVITGLVLSALSWRAKEAARKAEYRAKQESGRLVKQQLTELCPTGQPQDSRVTPLGVRTLSDTDTDTEIQIHPPTPHGGAPVRHEEGDQGHAPKQRRATATSKAKDAPPAMAQVADLLSAGFSEQQAKDFIAHKLAVKAPLTERAWSDHLRESAAAGWSAVAAAEKVMAKGWKGFEAKYVSNQQPPNQQHQSSQSAADADFIRTKKYLESQSRQTEADRKAAIEAAKKLRGIRSANTIGG
jgi:hypothetical protein